MSHSLQDKLNKEVEEHNALHSQIQAGEQQIVGMREDLLRRRGRIDLLSEQLQESQSEQAEQFDGLVAVLDEGKPNE